MKNITNALIPLAVLALFGSCIVGFFSLLVLLVRLFGFVDVLPLVFYQRMNVPLISVALPMVGMILFATILLGLPRKHAEAIEPTASEEVTNLPIKNEEEIEEQRIKAA